MFLALTIPERAVAVDDNNEADWITAVSPDQRELFHLLFADLSETKHEQAVQ